MDTTLQKWGNSQGIRIPKAILDTLHWAGEEQLSMNVEEGKLVIERAAKRKTIKELFAGFEGEYQPVDVDWGDPVGEEVW